MEADLKMDLRQFNDALAIAAELSSRGAAVAMNTRAYAIAVEAAWATEKANVQRIQHELGAIGNSVAFKKALPLRVQKRGKNKGALLLSREARFKRGRLIIRDDSFAARILLKRIRDGGAIDFMPTPEELKRMVTRMIRGRVATAGFIASGWVYAAKALRSLAKLRKKEIPPGVRMWGTQKKGSAIPARPSKKPADLMKVTIENSALIASGGQHQSPGSYNPMPVAERGLRIAVQKEWAELKRHLLTRYASELKARGFVLQ